MDAFMASATPASHDPDSRVGIANYLTLGAAFISIGCITCLVAALQLIAGYTPGPLAPCIGLAAGILLILRLGDWRSRGRTLITYIVVISCLLAISGLLYDLSYDGMWYHQEGVIQIAKGWNPYRVKAPTEAGSAAFWIDHYASGSWVGQASLFNTFHEIETGKILTALYGVGAFFLCLQLLVSLSISWGRPTRTSTLVFFAVLAAANPVFIYQVSTFMVDGQIAALTLSLGCLLAGLWLDWNKKFVAILAGLILPVLLNLKASTIFVVVVFLAVWIFAMVSAKRGRLPKSLWIVPVIATVFGIFVIGYQPYVQNLREFRNPVYPIPLPFSGGQRLIYDEGMHANSPGRFPGANRFIKLGYSLFAYSANGLGKDPVLKVPFAVRASERHCFTVAECRLGGFGPWFSGAVVLSFVLLVAVVLNGSIPKHWKRKLYWVLAILLFSVFLNSEPWWARYVPQLWLFPLAVAVFAWLATPQVPMRRLAAAVLVAMAVNASSLALLNWRWQALGTLRYRHRLEQRANEPQPVGVVLEPFRSHRVKLQQRGIRYFESDTGSTIPWDR